MEILCTVSTSVVSEDFQQYFQKRIRKEPGCYTPFGPATFSKHHFVFQRGCNETYCSLFHNRHIASFPALPIKCVLLHSVAFVPDERYDDHSRPHTGSLYGKIVVQELFRNSFEII